MLTVEKRKTLIEDYRLHEKDTGSPEVQIALLSARIEYLTEHSRRTRRIIIPAAVCSSSSVREEDCSTTSKQTMSSDIEPLSNVWASGSNYIVIQGRKAKV